MTVKALGYGAKGDTGAKGAAGAVGPTGAMGPQGIKGDTGPVGAVGPQGAKGDTGAAGASGVQGAKGDTGLTGAQGATGAASTVPGPQGPTGAASTVAGPQGPQGVAGPTGATGPAGSNATATPLGTATPKANGTATAGVATAASREDHVHPLQGGTLSLVGTATVGETVLVSLSLGVKRYTVPMAGLAVGDRVMAFLTGSPGASSLQDVYVSAANTLNVGLLNPALGIGAVISVPIACFRLN